MDEGNREPTSRLFHDVIGTDETIHPISEFASGYLMNGEVCVSLQDPLPRTGSYCAYRTGNGCV